MLLSIPVRNRYRFSEIPKHETVTNKRQLRKPRFASLRVITSFLSVVYPIGSMCPYSTYLGLEVPI